jgi:hypothetical protein
MKKILLLAVLIIGGFVQNSYSQDSTSQQQLSQLLTHYYSIKDAMVAGNSGTAAIKAEEFLKTANSIDYKIISEGNINALVKDATVISGLKDINKQRARFANLSDNMSSLVKLVKFSSEPIYQIYCPMKKANWLSSEKDIKNPYYGSAMLTCGKVVDTIQ